MFGLELIAKLFKILRSGGSPGQISGGFILGMILGLTPLWNLHNLIVFFLLVIINVNLGAAIFAFLIFSTIAYLLDPLFHSMGYYLLTGIPGLVFCIVGIKRKGHRKLAVAGIAICVFFLFFQIPVLFLRV